MSLPARTPRGMAALGRGVPVLPGLSEKIVAAAAKCGPFPLSSPNDFALLIPLDAGAHSALINGVSDTTGNATIEVWLME